jgi:Flp pilus assembly protein TadG
MCEQKNGFASDAAGAVAITFGLTAMVLAAAVGAVDYGRAVNARTEMQHASDAAALAAAAVAEEDRIGLATQIFNANYTAKSGVNVTVSSTGTKVTVSATDAIATSLLGVVGIEQLAIGASSAAEAYVASANPLCVLLLETSEIGLYVNAFSKLDATCGVHINSKNKEALYANSNSRLATTGICVNGTSRLNSGATATPPPIDGCPPKDDPLVSLAEPLERLLPCTFTDYKVASGQRKTMVPGVYCKKTLIENGGRAVMLPGVYIFRTGEFVVNSGASVTGDGVMMYFQDKDTRLNVNSNSTFTLSAPKSGTYAGVLLFQSRRPETLTAPPHIVNSNGNFQLEGTIYAPNGIVEINSQSIANQLADYTTVIARKMILNEHGTFTVRSHFDGDTPLPPLLESFRGTASGSRLVH